MKGRVNLDADASADDNSAAADASDLLQKKAIVGTGEDERGHCALGTENGEVRGYLISASSCDMERSIAAVIYSGGCDRKCSGLNPVRQH